MMELVSDALVYMPPALKPRSPRSALQGPRQLPPHPTSLQWPQRASALCIEAAPTFWCNNLCAYLDLELQLRVDGVHHLCSLHCASSLIALSYHLHIHTVYQIRKYVQIPFAF